MAGRHTYLTRLFALLLAGALLPGTAALAAEPEQAVPSAAIYTTSNMFGKVYAQDPLTGHIGKGKLPEGSLLYDTGTQGYGGTPSCWTQGMQFPPA